jgi:hypothetical protein
MPLDHAPSSDVIAQAIALIRARGRELAYAEAKRRAREERKGALADAGPHFWDNVRREIERIIRHE